VLEAKDALDGEESVARSDTLVTLLITWFTRTQCLGLQNISGLITHLVFPNAAPWFYDVYGEDAAQPNYEDYPGNPAGLVRVDRILGSE
jgi:hypothetical protein